MKVAIVLTSINDCSKLLEGYLYNFAKYGRAEDSTIYMIPDLKTPAVKLPIEVKVPDLDTQDSFLRSIGYPPEEIPRNSDCRRNVGYLMALATGAEWVISIDDDNWCPENDDFIGKHTRPRGDSSSVSTKSGWYNNCRQLYPFSFYPRGFPYFARTRLDIPEWRFFPRDESPVAINAGMWTVDPDVDAITWLAGVPKVEIASGSMSLAPDTWCPINSQNTAIRRDAMAAYYYPQLEGRERNADIYQGYFALACAKHLGLTARFGAPVVEHRRNSHNHLFDVANEIRSVLLLEELLPKLVAAKLSGSTFVEVYLSLADFLETQKMRFYLDTARRMSLWARAFKVVAL